ncbi:hypothetical protein DIPPA_50894 [Diplonema papillatum]|nr:hypothetical protein DIPPA_50894 [Diplonema papillatum]
MHKRTLTMKEKKMCTIKIFGVERDRSIAWMSAIIRPFDGVVLDRHLQGEDGKSNVVTRFPSKQAWNRAFRKLASRGFKKIKPMKKYDIPVRQGEYIRCDFPGIGELGYAEQLDLILAVCKMIGARCCADKYVCVINGSVYIEPWQTHTRIKPELLQTFCSNENRLLDAWQFKRKAGGSLYGHTLQLGQKRRLYNNCGHLTVVVVADRNGQYTIDATDENGNAAAASNRATAAQQHQQQLHQQLLPHEQQLSQPMDHGNGSNNPTNNGTAAAASNPAMNLTAVRSFNDGTASKTVLARTVDTSSNDTSKDPHWRHNPYASIPGLEYSGLCSNCRSLLSSTTPNLDQDAVRTVQERQPEKSVCEKCAKLPTRVVPNE